MIELWLEMAGNGCNQLEIAGMLGNHLKLLEMAAQRSGHPAYCRKQVVVGIAQ